LLIHDHNLRYALNRIKGYPGFTLQSEKIPRNEKIVRNARKSLGLKVPNIPITKNARKQARNDRGGDSPESNPTIHPQIKGRAISYK
jgi:hypothetical protein